MPIFSVTGHMDLTDDTAVKVREALDAMFAAQPRRGELVGVSCLAPGADILFAEAVLDAGGALAVVLPSRDYRRVHVKPDHAPAFDKLLEAASEVTVMPFETAGQQAYEAANAELLRRADVLVAVWDGSPPSGRGGGTADTVHAARDAGTPVRRVWPEGAARRG